MSEQVTFSLNMPQNKEGISSINVRKSIVIIGANGSGKTRLGTWIELDSPHKSKVHRISAQKSLSMPDSTTPKSIELAESKLLFGDEAAIRLGNPVNYKRSSRWGQNPNTSLLNDFHGLMELLFSQQIEDDAKYKNDSKKSANRIEPKPTKLEKTKEIWEKILPHRELIIGGLRIQAKIKADGGRLYPASEMSDGERVIFYLIGQCQVAHQDGIIIIDEPELHLHKSIQQQLWAEIEKSRPDCHFIYLTHDVQFAASQEDAQRVWLKSFDGNTWDWALIEKDKNIPDELFLELLGSRKKGRLRRRNEGK